MHKEQFVSVEKALQSGVGGLSYVTTGLLTKHGHFVGTYLLRAIADMLDVVNHFFDI